MQNELESYLKNIGLQIDNLSMEKKFIEELKILLSEKLQKEEEMGLEEMPYKVKEILFHNNFKNEDIRKLISKLNKFILFLDKEIGADWTGIYKKLNTKECPAMIKLAYRGFASRIEFPLTQKFAEQSNNSAVGLTGKAVVINNIKKHLQEGKPYYKADRKVQSELCFPIFSKNKEIIGIIDLESFTENFFNDTKILKVAAACMLLGEQL